MELAEDLISESFKHKDSFCGECYSKICCEGMADMVLFLLIAGVCCIRLKEKVGECTNHEIMWVLLNLPKIGRILNVGFPICKRRT